MAGPSEKARLFLESSLDDLQELERKDVFTKVVCTAGRRRA